MTPEELLKRLAVLFESNAISDGIDNAIAFGGGHRVMRHRKQLEWKQLRSELTAYLPAQVSPDAPRQLELGEDVE